MKNAKADVSIYPVYDEIRDSPFYELDEDCIHTLWGHSISGKDPIIDTDENMIVSVNRIVNLDEK